MVRPGRLDVLHVLDRGGVEIFCAAGLALLTLSTPNPSDAGASALLWQLALCAGAALCPWRLTIGCVVSTIALCGCLQLPPQHVGAAFHACLIPLFSATRQNRPKHAWIVFTTYLVAVTYEVTRDVETPGQVFTYLLAWLFLFSIAGLAGQLLASLARRGDRAKQEALDAQRRRLARHLHDTVAHDLSVIVMTSQRAELSGKDNSEALALISRTAQQGVAGLRALMEQLTEPGHDHSVDSVGSLSSTISTQSRQLRSQGFLVMDSMEGDINALPARIDQCLARIAREALHNIAVHGDPSQTCQLLIEVTTNTATVLVMNHRKPQHPATSHAGTGLTNMRREIQSVGGVLQAGPRGQQWIVRATCPIISISPEEK